MKMSPIITLTFSKSQLLFVLWFLRRTWSVWFIFYPLRRTSLWKHRCSDVAWCDVFCTWYWRVVFPLTNIFNEMSKVWLLVFNWCVRRLFLLQAAKKKKKSHLLPDWYYQCVLADKACVSSSLTFSCLQMESLHGKWNWSFLSNT